ncbi:hypothetical protein LEMLEM_LOCUS4138, partial [Lemmus lemmus]
MMQMDRDVRLRIARIKPASVLGIILKALHMLAIVACVFMTRCSWMRGRPSGLSCIVLGATSSAVRRTSQGSTP